MALKKQNPSCDCCCIKIFEDTFDRANNASLGADWTEVAGDAEILSNAVRVNSANTLVVCNTTDGAVVGESIHVEFTITSSLTTGDEFIVFLGYLDSNNYHYAKLTYNDGASGDFLSDFSMGKYVAGVHTLLRTHDRFPVGSPLMICYTSSGILVAGGGDVLGGLTSNGYRMCVWGETLAGNQFGFGTGALASTAGYNNFIAYRTTTTLMPAPPPPNTCRNCMVCSQCLTGHVAEEVTVVVSGMVNGTCLDCASFNGTYVLPHLGRAFLNTASCTWTYELAAPMCVASAPITEKYWARFTYNTAGNAVFGFFNDELTADTSAISWDFQALGTYWDCENINLTFSTFGSGARCTGSATAVLTAP